MTTIDQLKADSSINALLTPNLIDWVISNATDVIFALNIDGVLTQSDAVKESILPALEAIQQHVFLFTSHSYDYVTEIGAGDYPNVVAENGRVVKINGEATTYDPHPDVAKNTEAMKNLLTTLPHNFVLAPEMAGYTVSFEKGALPKEVGEVKKLMERQAAFSARAFILDKGEGGHFLRITDANFYSKGSALLILKNSLLSTLCWVACGHDPCIDCTMAITADAFIIQCDNIKGLDTVTSPADFVSILSWFAKVRTAVANNAIEGFTWEILNPLLRK